MVVEGAEVMVRGMVVVLVVLGLLGTCGLSGLPPFRSSGIHVQIQGARRLQAWKIA